jgi:hypothetical protein
LKLNWQTAAAERKPTLAAATAAAATARDAALSWYMKHWNQEDGKGVWDNYDWDSNSWGAVVLLNRCETKNLARIGLARCTGITPLRDAQ